MKSVNKNCPVGIKIQSIIFSKDKFTEKSAKSWAESNDFKYGKVDEKLNTYRLRQNAPSEYRKGSFRTIDITDGVKAIVACPIDSSKKSIKKPSFAKGGSVQSKKIKDILLGAGFDQDSWFKEGKDAYGNSRPNAYGFWDEQLTERYGENIDTGKKLDAELDKLGIRSVNIWVGSSVHGWTHRLLFLKGADNSYEDGGQTIPEPNKFHLGQVLHTKTDGDIKVLDIKWVDPKVSITSPFGVYKYYFAISEEDDSVGYEMYEYELEMLLDDNTVIDYEKSYEKYLSSYPDYAKKYADDFKSFVIRINSSEYFLRHPEFNLSEQMSGLAKKYLVYTNESGYEYGGETVGHITQEQEGEIITKWATQGLDEDDVVDAIFYAKSLYPDIDEDAVTEIFYQWIADTKSEFEYIDFEDNVDFEDDEYSNGGKIERRYKLSAEQYTKLIDSGLWTSKKSDIIGNYNIYSKDGDKLVAVWSLPKERLTLRGDFEDLSSWIKNNGIEAFASGGAVKQYYMTRNGKHLYMNKDAIWYLSYGAYKLGDDGKEYSTSDREVRVYRKSSGLSEIKHYRKDKNYRVIDERFSDNGELYYIAFLDKSDNVNTIVFSLGDLYAKGGSLNKIYRFNEFGVKSFKNLIDEGVFVSKFKSKQNAIDFDRIKFNRMDNAQQVEYVKKFNKEKIVHNLRLRDGGLHEVSKEVYDYAQIPETEEINYYTKYEDGGMVDYKKFEEKLGRSLKIKDIENIENGTKLAYVYKDTTYDNFDGYSFGVGEVRFDEKLGEWDIDGYPFDMQSDEIVENKNNPDYELQNISNQEFEWSLYFVNDKKYSYGGGIGNYSEAEKWWGNDLSLNEQKEYAKKHLASFEYDELLGTTSKYSTRERRQKFINEIWEKQGSPKSVLKGLYSDGGVIAPSRYDFRRPKFESPVDTLLIDGYKTAPTKSMVYGDLDKVKSRFREESEYAQFSPVVAVVYPYQRGWDRGYKIYYSTDKEVPMGFVDEINGKRYVYHIGGSKMADGGKVGKAYRLVPYKELSAGYITSAAELQKRVEGSLDDAISTARKMMDDDAAFTQVHISTIGKNVLMSKNVGVLKRGESQISKFDDGGEIYNGWEKQKEWHGNPALGLDSYKKIFNFHGGKIPVYIFGKEGSGKDTPIWGEDKYGNRVITGKRDFPDWEFVVSAGANSQYSYSGGFYPITPTLKEAMDIVDEKYRKGRLIYKDGGAISTDYKYAISDLIEYYRSKSKFKLEKYAVLTQEQGEYLYNAFKNYESLKNEDGEYVAQIKFAYDGKNFEETKEQDEALTKFLEELDETGFIYFDEYDSLIQAYPIAIEFVDAVRGRMSTLKAKQSGTDLFPEMDGGSKEVVSGVKQIDLPDTDVNKIYTTFFDNKVMEDYFGDALQTFWDNNKGKWSDEYVSKLRAGGFSDRDIFAILFGYISVQELKCEREFELNGILAKREGTQNSLIDEIISEKKSGYYTAGLKYPIPLNILIDQLFAKYKINEEPLIFDVDTSRGIGTVKIYIYKGDGIYIGKTVYTDREKTPIDKYDTLNGGYVGIVADSSEKIYDAIGILFNDEESYVKDLNLFYNGLGGIDANDIVSAFGEAKPSVIEDAKPVSVELSKEPTREEIEEAIKGLQVMVELEPENNIYTEAIDGLKIYLETITEEENTEVKVPVIEEPKGEIGDYYDLRLPLGEKVGINESISRRIRDLFVRKEGKLNKIIMDNTISAMSERTPQYAKAWKNFKKTFDIEEVDGNYINPYYEYGGDVKDVLVGGKADGMMLDDIASMHGVALDHILRQAKIGISVEREHTSDYDKIIEIVKDHLYESPDYYTKLQKIESSFESGGGVGGYYIDVPKEHKSIFTMKALMEIRGMQINSGVEQVDGTFRFTFLNESDLDKAVAILNIIQRPDYGRDMPQNLSQLKKYIQVGKLLRVSYNKNRPDWVGKMKVVVQVQTNGFYMMDGVEVPDDISKKSWIEYPKSDMVAFSPFWFSIYAKDKQGNKVKMLQYEYVIGEQEKIAKSVEKDETLLFNEAVKMNEFVDSVYRLSDSVEFGKGGSLTPDMFDNNLDYNFDNQSVSCFINAKNTGRTLVLRRSGSDYSGTWSLMSGGVDAGESPDETIKREIQEELGVNLNCDNLIFMNATKHPDRTHYYYEMSVNEEFEPVLNHENDAYMWVNMAELPDNTHPLLKKYIKSEVFA